MTTMQVIKRLNELNDGGFEWCNLDVANPRVLLSDLRKLGGESRDNPVGIAVAFNGWLLCTDIDNSARVNVTRIK